MKNLIKLIGIITLVTALGFSMVACGGDDEEDIPIGKLTITGFDFDLNGYFVEADVLIDTPEVTYIFAAKSYDADEEEVEFGEIANRRVSLNVWEEKGAGPVGFTGSNTLTFTVYLYAAADDDEPEKTGEVTIKFKRGIGIGEIENIIAYP